MASSIDIKAFNCVFHETSASVHGESRPSDVAKVVVRRAAQVLKAKGAFIQTLNLETNKIDLAVSYGLSEKFLTKRPVYSENLIKDLYRQNHVRIIKDILHDPHIQDPKEKWEEGIRMVVDSPLIFQDRIVGIIRIFFGEERTLSEEEFNFLIFTSRQGACAIEKTRLIHGQRERYEQLALRTEKLSALGRMAAGIAHEINNPLTGILLYGSNLTKKTSDESAIKEGLSIIVREAKRCKGIVQNLLEFSRDKTPERSLASVNEIIEKTLDILENEIHLHHVSVKNYLSREMPDILLDVNLIQQVFVNLLVNALEAIQENGSITIHTRMSPDQTYEIVEISDTGCGISQEHMSKIFDPFFSTKSNGTGLGLAVSYGIIQKHEGDIQVSSRPGQGTRFTIQIPVVQESKKSTVMKPIKVLLVDDEKDFVETLYGRIKKRKLEADVAFNGEQALELVAHQVPDVMVLDLNMPNLDGMEVLRSVKETYPEVEIIILTGYGSKYSKIDALLLGAFEFMEKPVNIDELIQTIQKAHEHKIQKSRATNGGYENVKTVSKIRHGPQIA